MKTKSYSKTQLISLLKAWARKHGEVPSKRQWNEDANTPSDIPYRQHFGSWGKALLAAKLQPKLAPHYGRQVGARNRKRLRLINAYGYIQLYEPKHREARRNGYVAEHRMVVSDLLGRKLHPKNDVHHINGIKTDNRPNNLQLISHADHTSHHWKEKPRKQHL